MPYFELPPWAGDIHALLPQHYVGAIVTVASVLCGAIVGSERERREKPAGLRTMMLICLGACVFTQAGLLIGGGQFSDRGRIAAQVVTGVGFLGAGAIIRERGMVIGFTTGAAIWAVAAIGVVVGSGYVAAGVCFTVLAVLTLAAERFLEPLFLGRCRWYRVRITFDAESGKTLHAIRDILDDHQIADKNVHFDTEEQTGTVTIRFCNRHRQHRAFLPIIAGLRTVKAVTAVEPARKRLRGGGVDA